MKDIKINFKPTELQKKHMKSIEWLLGDTRADGKTCLMAFVFLKKAINNPNQTIKLFDHYAGMHARNLIKEEIDRMLPDELRPFFDFGYDTVTLRLR